MTNTNTRGSFNTPAQDAQAARFWTRHALRERLLRALQLTERAYRRAARDLAEIPDAPAAFLEVLEGLKIDYMNAQEDLIDCGFCTDADFA